MKSNFGVGILSLVCVLILSCTWLETENLVIRPISRVTYECEENVLIEASYYALDDGSLEFVRIKMPDGKTRTLPRVLSASGVRYTDEMDLLWWTKGNSARCETRAADGSWRILYENCRVTSHISLRD
ncbi:MAG TPA: MliC family protein [Syntrophales bacterium]|nr:MliC family protein [Syntrophales bacterium]HOL58460.1 MliC family protein [Syntrophales bacterium]HPO34931.1 MliC family protein [Syntrophales bacterium]